MWFKRNDGQLFEADANSAAFEAMAKSAEFETLELKDERDIEADKPALEHTDAPEAAGQRGSAKRGRTRKGNKADDS